MTNNTWLENLQSLRDFINQQINQLDINSIISQYGFEFQYESFSLPEPIIIATWFQPLLSLSENLIFFDIIWRIFQTFRISYRFWKGTSIKIPPVDIRNKSTHIFSNIIEIFMSTTIQLYTFTLFIIGMIIIILVTLSGKYLLLNI